MRALVAAAAMVVLAGAALRIAPDRRVVQLPAGVVELRSEMPVGRNTEVRGSPAGTVLRMSAGFAGLAAIVVRGNGVRLTGFTIDGNRNRDGGLSRSNGVFADRVSGLVLENVRFRNIAGFAVVARRVRDVTIDRATVADSGSLNKLGRNDTTGGILLEEGSADFRVTRCDLRNIRGNGIWTHSWYGSPRNARGIIAQNRFQEIGRDAIQVGHATQVRVEENTGRRIGYPREIVDIENLAVPVGVDTAGNVDRSSYTNNRFEDVNGKCIDLDGFHDGEVRGNVCVKLGNFGIVMNNSNPDMRSRNIRIVDNTFDGVKFGGIFVIGTGHRIAHNRLLNLNTAHCDACLYAADEPDMLRSGIYLGKGAERLDPARENTIEDNEITGYKMKARCIAAAPGIQPGWNIIRDNRCE